MRRDIQINTAIHDVVLSNNNRNGIYPFEWVLETDLYLMGQITIPYTFDIQKLQTQGVKVEIPYTPIYKPFKIRIMRMYDESNYTAVINPVDGSEWFNIHALLWQQRNMIVCASQLIMISQGDYLVQLDNTNGIGYIWSADDTDFININANIQNRNLLLQCVPTNNYRYPLSGIGLVRYLHSNLSQTKLATVIENEFKADKVIVKSAAFDSFTGDIELDLDFTEADASV